MRDDRGEAKRWLKQAENDLAFGRLALRESFWAQACFIAQQSAEKAVKSIGYGLGERTVFGHSLVELVDRFRDRAPALATLREIGGLLDQYYVAARYPNGLAGGVPFEAFGERQGHEAIEGAARFVELARTASGG